MEHISKDIIGSKSRLLQGKRITLCLSGSVAVIKAVDLARELMRHGAEVFPVMTQAATELITPEFMEWATGNAAVTRLTGRVEHIELAGNVDSKSDLILVAPSTANTISKIALGIDDTPVTSVVTSAFGEGIPLMLVPAMHLSMYKHPILKENIRKLEALGVEFIHSRLEEGKAKIAEVPEIVEAVLHRLAASRGLLEGKKVIITAGPTVEYIDPIRVISNRSSGKMGAALARESLAAGARVTVVYGPGSAILPPGVKVLPVETSEEMFVAVKEELEAEPCDICIAAAAVGDWTVKRRSKEKISTHAHKSINLELVPTIKIIDRIKELSPSTRLVCFRALSDLETSELLDNARNRMNKADGDYIVVNDVARKGAGFQVDTNEVHIIDREGHTVHLPLASKDQIAREIIKKVSEGL